ncbi:MFS transporter [Ottowia sp.]|uniref:MFS transporter n=1 Tax=Ottowia sp. TaxID=1898956 RepID=UPI0025F9281C|nr:MFS transporter [Ottowia sp.]
MSTTPIMLIIRAWQGLSGALVQPQVLGLLAVNFDNQDRGRVFGLYAAALGCAGIAAQLLGGVLVGTLPADIGWRACFMVSVPLCAFSMIFASDATDGARGELKKVDITGAALLGVSLACICTFLTMGREQGWPVWSFEVFAAGLVSLALLWYWQDAGHKARDERIIPAGILVENAFWLSLATIFVFYAGVASLYFVLALELRVTCGFSPVEVGLLFGWLAVCFVTTSTSKQFKAKVAPGAEIGLVILAAGHVCMYWAGAQSKGYAQVAWFLLSCGIQGAGIGCLMGPLMATALSKVKAQQASVGGGIASAMQQVGNSIGIAAIGFAYFASQAGGRASIGGAVVYLVGMLVLLGALVVLAKRGRKGCRGASAAVPSSEGTGVGGLAA